MSKTQDPKTTTPQKPENGAGAQSPAGADPKAAKRKHATPALRIAATREGFRRCGVSFSTAAQDFEAGTFSPEEVERLKADASLVVVEIG